MSWAWEGYITGTISPLTTNTEEILFVFYYYVGIIYLSLLFIDSRNLILQSYVRWVCVARNSFQVTKSIYRS